MGWIKVLPQAELPTGTRQVVKANSRPVLLVNHQGTVYAMDSRCPHVKLSLKKGQITPDGAIVCPWHRSEFDLCTGAVKTWTPWPPGVGKVLGMIAQEKTLPVYPTRIEDGSIWVELGDN